jgi:Zn-dependent membrane protease YugP
MENQISFGPAMLISILFMGLGMLASWRLKSKFAIYSKIPSRSGKTGKDIAEQMLREYGIFDVRVISVQGQLTDHYNPADKTVNLSKEVYYGSNAAASAVAAHECGHAVQHATGYEALKLRSALVPIQNASGMIINIVMMATVFGGAVLYSVFPIDLVLWLIVIAYGGIALFSIITLPVEFDASKRALIWIEKSGHASREELARSKDALNCAALTYVIAALGAIATLVYYAAQLLGRRND